MNTILTDEELSSIKDDHRDQLVEDALLRSVEAAVLAKLARQEPVAWMVMNGVCNYQLFWSKHQADALCAQMQKRHDLSGSLASFHVQPLYTHPAPQQAAFEAELRHLHALNDELTKAYRKMYNAAAGYSNYCEDSASVRQCDRDFEEADAMFRAALAQENVK